MDKIKCNKCKKNILISFECKCNSIFCINHKNPELHNCTFNFKENGKNELIKNNPKITFTKVIKI